MGSQEFYFAHFYLNNFKEHILNYNPYLINIFIGITIWTNLFWFIMYSVLKKWV